jgi:hypothetical protein
VTSVWTAVIVAVAVLASLAVGIWVGMLIARRNTYRGFQPMREPRADERLAAVYLEVAVGWHAYLQAVRPLVFPEEGFEASRPRDLSSVLRSRAQLDRFGSPSVQQLHDGALDGAVTLINLLQSLLQSPITGESDVAAGQRSLRIALAEISRKVDLLEWQMNSEIHPLARLTEQHVELTGRRGAVPQTVTGDRRQGS